MLRFAGNTKLQETQLFDRTNVSTLSLSISGLHCAIWFSLQSTFVFQHIPTVGSGSIRAFYGFSVLDQNSSSKPQPRNVQKPLDLCSARALEADEETSLARLVHGSDDNYRHADLSARVKHFGSRKWQKVTARARFDIVSLASMTSRKTINFTTVVENSDPIELQLNLFMYGTIQSHLPCDWETKPMNSESCTHIYGNWYVLTKTTHCCFRVLFATSLKDIVLENNAKHCKDSYRVPMNALTHLALKLYCNIAPRFAEKLLCVWFFWNTYYCINGRDSLNAPPGAKAIDINSVLSVLMKTFIFSKQVRHVLQETFKERFACCQDMMHAVILTHLMFMLIDYYYCIAYVAFNDITCREKSNHFDVRNWIQHIWKDSVFALMHTLR